MSDLETGLVLRMEATLSKFEKQMAKARKVATDYSTTAEKSFERAHSKMAKSAESSAAVIGREMDRLQTKYDPVYAASKRYELALDELNNAMKIGAINSKTYDAALETLNAEYSRSAISSKAMATGMGGVQTKIRGMRGGIQNVAYQVGDFAVQVGAGTSATQALGQQLPQLLGGFGVLGAVLGAVAAISVPLAGAFFNMGGGAKDLEERQRDLEAAVNDYRDAVKSATVPTAELAEKYGTATGAAREFLTALESIASFEALRQLDSEVKSLAETFGVFETEINRGGSIYAATVRRVSDELGVSREAARGLVEEFQSLAAAEGPKAQADAISDITAAMEDALGPFDDMDEAAQEIYKGLIEAGKSAADLQGAADGAERSLSGAASQAGRIADEMARAAENAADMVAASVSDLQRAQIEFDYKDDPVGRAGALAAADFDNGQNYDALASTSAISALAGQRDQVISNAEALARLKQRTSEWTDAQREAIKAATAGAKSRANAPGLFDVSDTQIQNLERELELIGMSSERVAELRAKWAMLDEAKRQGIDVNDSLTAAIDRQSEAVGRVAGEHERAAEQYQSIADLQGDVKDGLLDAIVAGEDFGDVMAGVAEQIAKAALQAALFNEGMFASGSGSGLVGGLVSAVAGAFTGGTSAGVTANAKGNAFSGGRVTAFATGGVVSGPTTFPMPNGRGLMGEAGPEAIMPLTRMANGKLGVSGAGAGGSGGETQVNVINNTGAEVQTSTRNSGGKEIVDVMIGSIVSDMARNGPISRSMQASFGMSRALRGR